MCGLFGAIGKNISSDKIRALALVNRARGTDGTGLFDNSGKSVKHGGDALFALANNDFTAFLAHRARWFLAGHTRAATQGKVSKRNAHPFRYGSIIGAHNGIVSAPDEYKVDSEYLIDSLDKSGNDYQKALADIDGWWALTWFDGDAFYMQASGNDVSIGRDETGTYYYSSDDRHLAAATGITSNVLTLDKGATIRFKSGCDDFEVLPDLKRSIGFTKNPIITYKGDWTKSSKSTKGEALPIYDDFKSRSDHSDWDRLAWDLGYDSIEDVMRTEGLRSIADAKDLLESELYSTWHDYSEGID